MSNFAMTYKNQDIVNKAIAFLLGYAIQFSLSYEDKFGKNPKITITCDVGVGKSFTVPSSDRCFESLDGPVLFLGVGSIWIADNPYSFPKMRGACI